MESCKPNTYCLNSKLHKKFLLKYITSKIKGKNELLYKDFGFYFSKDKNYVFKLTPVLEGKDVILYIFDKKSKKDKLSYCLKLTLKKRYEKDGFYYFKESKVDNINRGVCGIKKKVIKTTIDGTYLIKLVDVINKIFKVKISKLDDDARITICDTMIKIKLIKLLSTGKTWYEKSGGYELAEKEIYKYAKEVAETKYEYYYNLMKTEPLSMFDGDYEKIDEKELDKTLKILKKYNLSEKDTIKKIIKKIFETKDGSIANCDKKHIYKYILDLPSRMKAYKNKDEKYNKYRSYYDLLRSITGFNESIKKY